MSDEARQETPPAAEEALISVDVETGGPVPGLYPLLAIGACLVDDTKERFYIELKPRGERIDEEMVVISWPHEPAAKTLARLEAEGLAPQAALRAFAAWVREVAGARRPVYVAWGAAFDWAFTHHAFTFLGLEDPFGYAPLDVKAYWAGRAQVSFDETRKSRLPRSLSAGLGEHAHRADEDAVRQAELFKRMRDWRS